ncbi:MAG TPA: AraC family transcriptional regulator [bacterium]|nr:AraC family transcriptional regulator [bacterium]
MREHARLWRAEDLGGLELLRARYVTHAFAPHAHEEFMIAVIEAGAVAATCRGTSHVAGAGDILLVNPGEVHAGQPARGTVWQYRALYPDADLLRAVAVDLAGAGGHIPRFPCYVVHDLEIAAALRRLHVTLERADAALLERQSLLIRALARLVARHAVDRPSPRRIGREHLAVRAARAYLDAHASEDVSLVTLARESALSPFHLCRTFHREVGLPPHAYQTQVRVQRARSLLRQGVPIADAATAAGFYDQAHLTRRFKRAVGVTPGQYVAASAASSPR